MAGKTGCSEFFSAQHLLFGALQLGHPELGNLSVGSEADIAVFNLIDGELEYEFVTKGYDLGLVNESNLDEVIAEAPGEDHRSYIEMDGVAGIHYGQFIVELVWAWLVLFTLAPMTIAFSNRVRIEKPQLL